MKVVCHYDPPPIPIRRFDWTAIDADTYDGPGSPIGHGRTEADARADLEQEIALREGRS